MVKRFIDKFMCLHKWTSHNKNTDFRANRTTEVLICRECGKITKIEY